MGKKQDAEAAAKEKLKEAKKSIIGGDEDSKNNQLFEKTIQLSALDIQEQHAIDWLTDDKYGDTVNKNKKTWEEWKVFFPAAPAAAAAGAAAAPVALPEWLTDWIKNFEPPVKTRVDFIVPGIKQEFYNKVLEATQLLIDKKTDHIPGKLAEVVASTLVLQASEAVAAAAAAGAVPAAAAAVPAPVPAAAVIEVLRIIEVARAAVAAAAAAPAAAAAVTAATGLVAEAQAIQAAAGGGGGGGVAVPQAAALLIAEAIIQGQLPVVKKDVDHIIYEGVLKGWKFMVKNTIPAKKEGEIITNKFLKDFAKAVLSKKTLKELENILIKKEEEEEEEEEDEEEEEEEDSTCHEKTIELPDNTSAVCWWLSVNFALFHKKRQELDVFFKNPDYSKFIDEEKKEPFNIIAKNLSTIYNYYSSGKTDEKNITTFISTTMVSDQMQNVFNKEGFEVQSKKYQDALEYLQTLFNYIDQIPIVMLTRDSNNLSLYDINLFRKFYGYQEADIKNLRGPATTRPARRYNKNTKTILFAFNRRSHTEKEERNPTKDSILIKESITVPLFDTEETNRELLSKQTFNTDFPDVPIKAQFKLDAVVRAIPGHFTAVVKCSDSSDTWVDYNAMGGKGNRPAYKNFEEMVKALELNTTASILFYTRVSS